jgi:hypothetical protein
MRADARLLCHNRDIHVQNPRLPQFHLPRRLLQKNPAWNSAPPGVGVWKKRSNITLAQRSQYCVAYRMHQHIRVRMTGQSLFMRDFNSAQNAFPSGLKRMHIVTYAHSKHAHNLTNQMLKSNKIRRQQLSDIGCIL